MREWWEHEVCDSYEETNLLINNRVTQSMQDQDDLHKVVTYQQSVPLEFFNHTFTDQEKRWLRPIAETLAMLDGNAFFGVDDTSEQYESYLPEAAAVFFSNGGYTGWPAGASWMKNEIHENDEVKNAYDNWRTIKVLSQSKT